MNETQIRRLARIMREMDLSGLELNERTGHLRLERNHMFSPDVADTETELERDYRDFDEAEALFDKDSDIEERSEPGKMKEKPPALGQKHKAEGGITLSEMIKTISSPTVGVFYISPAENADPYVKAGDSVKKGDVLCIIETMKLMNEITAEYDCVIEDVLAGNAQMVEYGTELFRVRTGD